MTIPYMLIGDAALLIVSSAILYQSHRNLALARKLVREATKMADSRGPVPTMLPPVRLEWERAGDGTRRLNLLGFPIWIEFDAAHEHFRLIHNGMQVEEFAAGDEAQDAGVRIAAFEHIKEHIQAQERDAELVRK